MRPLLDFLMLLGPTFLVVGLLCLLAAFGFRRRFPRFTKALVLSLAVGLASVALVYALAVSGVPLPLLMTRLLEKAMSPVYLFAQSSAGDSSVLLAQLAPMLLALEIALVVLVPVGVLIWLRSYKDARIGSKVVGH